MNINELIDIFNEMSDTYHFSDRIFCNEDFYDYMDDNYLVHEIWELIDLKTFNPNAPYFSHDGYEIISFDSISALREYITNNYGEEMKSYERE